MPGICGVPDSVKRSFGIVLEKNGAVFASIPNFAGDSIYLDFGPCLEVGAEVKVPAFALAEAAAIEKGEGVSMCN
jgi:hypothetical protein